MRTRRDAIPRRRTQGPTRWPPSSPESGTRVSEKGVSARGRKRPRQPPTVWERSGPVARARPWPHEACPAGGTWSCSAGSAAQPQRRTSGTPGGRGPEKRRFSTSGGRKGQGHSQERNSSPRGPVSEFGPFTSGHPLLWNFHPLSPGLAAGLGGMLGQAAGHRVLVRLESLTRLTCRLAPHLKRVWSAGSFGRSVEWEVTSSAASLAHEAE